MPRLTERLSKLEASPGAPRSRPPVAVLSARLPAEGDEQGWMMQMLSEHGWHDWLGDCVLGLSVVTIEGDVGVLLPPTPSCDLTPAQARVRNAAKNSFPRIEVCYFCESWVWQRHNDRAEFDAAAREAKPFLADLHRARVDYQNAPAS